MSKLSITGLSLLLAFFAVTIIITGPEPKKYSITSFSYNKIADIKGFNEGKINALNPDSLAGKYKEVRAIAKSKASQFITGRNRLNMLYQTLCILSIVASLIVSYLGATKGLMLNPTDVDTKMEAIKQETLTFKKRIIFLSILSLILTTASNRVMTSYDKAQNKANEIIDLIKSSDLKITTSINLNEVANTISALELDVEKY